MRVRFVVPGALGQRTGGYRYDARIIVGLRELGIEVNVSELAGSFPFADAAAKRAAAQCVAEARELLVIDGLALPAFTGLVLPPYVALIHHPHLRETDGTRDPRIAELARIERELTAAAAHVIVTSPSTARELGDLPRVAVVVPGTDPAPLARGSDGTQLLCVATVTPRKGHRVLLEALAELDERRWTLDCVGSLDRATEHAEEIRALATRRGLASRVSFHGEVDDAALAAHYDAADVFVLPSHYEGYGMVLAEALAHGIPIVATRGGAIPETVAEEAGLFVSPGAASELRDALAKILDDAELRARLRGGTARQRARLPRWSDAARTFGAALAEVRS